VKGCNAWRNFREFFKGEVRRIPIPRTPVDKGIKKGRISERFGPWVIPAALGGRVHEALARSVSNLRGPPGLGGRNDFEENRSLRKPLAAVLGVVWLVVVLTTAVASGHRSGVMSGSV
jgi:hypothetical protein